MLLAVKIIDIIYGNAYLESSLVLKILIWHFVIVMIICTFGRMFWVHHLFGVKFYQWFKTVVLPSFMIGLISATVSYIIIISLDESFHRLMFVLLVSILITILTSWFCILYSSEREFVKYNLKNLGMKLFCFVLERNELHY